MLQLLRKLAREPMLTGLVAIAVVFITVLLISAWMERKRNRKTQERKDRARKQHLGIQRQTPAPQASRLPSPAFPPKAAKDLGQLPSGKLP